MKTSFPARPPWILLLLVFLVAPVASAAEAPPPVTVNWLGNMTPPARDGVTWGVPWAQGKLPKDAPLTLRDAAGKSIPLQTWPLAYWPDGSIKWSGHAISASPETTGPFQLGPGTPAAPVHPIQVYQQDGKIDIIADPVRCIFPTKGSNLFEALYSGNRMVARNAQLIAIREDRTDFASQGILKQETFISEIKSVTLEQSGPVRAVVKIEGVHKAVKGTREWLPFVVRFYIYADGEPLRITHSFIYNGIADKDYIKGLGMTFNVPFAEEAQNRHVRFMGDGLGVWAQPVLLLPGYRQRVPQNIYEDQLNGRRVGNLVDFTANQQADILSCPYYNDMRIVQLGPNSFSIDKRVSDKDSWLHVTDGHRALGLAVLGDVTGGIAVGVKDFWQKYPEELEVRNAYANAGDLKVWFWSPNSDAMDVRVYDESLVYNNATELSVNYEDWKEGWGTPYGVANTHDLTLWTFSAVPSDAELVAMSKAASAPPLLVGTPAYFQSLQVLGRYSLPDRSTPAQAYVEDAVQGIYQFYHEQVDQRNWYGMWNYGDVMHNYDFDRHDWRYDVGGWAWLNTELTPDMLLWTMFLRSGDPEVFRMAEAMTRHTSEVDVHHLGVFYPLGTRHSVNHWGDGAKQPRISHAGIKRPYYFLTADERVGDLMHEQLPASLAYDYVRYIDPRSGRGANQPFNADGTLNVTFENPAWQAVHGGTIPTPAVNFGLDWTNYAINFTTEYERTGNVTWRDKVLEMMRYVAPETAEGQLRGGGGGLDLLFGGPETMFQIESEYDYPVFWAGWANTAANVGAPMAGGGMTGPTLTSYAAWAKKDSELGRRAWEQLIGNSVPTLRSPPLNDGPNVVNPVNDPALLGASVGWQQHGAASIHWALNALETMELAKDYLKDWQANPSTGRGGRGGNRGNGGGRRGNNADNAAPPDPDPAQ